MLRESTVAPVSELDFYGIQGSNPEPFRNVEIKWSRKEAEATNKNMSYIPPAGRAKLSQFLLEYCPMRRATVVFATPKESDPSGAEVAGSGICVRSGDAFGVLTARHVLVDPSGKRRHQSGLLIRFFDDRCITSKGFAVTRSPSWTLLPCHPRERTTGLARTARHCNPKDRQARDEHVPRGDTGGRQYGRTTVTPTGWT